MNNQISTEGFFDIFSKEKREQKQKEIYQKVVKQEFDKLEPEFKKIYQQAASACQSKFWEKFINLYNKSSKKHTVVSVIEQPKILTYQKFLDNCYNLLLTKRAKVGNELWFEIINNFVVLLTFKNETYYDDEELEEFSTEDLEDWFLHDMEQWTEKTGTAYKNCILHLPLNLELIKELDNKYKSKNTNLSSSIPLAILIYHTSLDSNKFYQNVENGIKNYKEGQESFMNTNKYFLDKGLELFGFGKPNDKEQKMSSVFGRITFYKDIDAWWSPSFVVPSKVYTTYNNKDQWAATYIEHPFSAYEGLGTEIKFIFNDPKNLYNLLLIFGKILNQNQEQNNSLAATCNPEQLAAGKDKRFFIRFLDFFTTDQLGKICNIVAYFNKRKVLFAISEDLRIYSAVTTSMWAEAVNKDTVSELSDINEFSSANISKLITAQFQGYEDINTTTVTPAVLDPTQEIITPQDPYVDGEYDKEDTDVTINSPDTTPDSNVADVDIKIDLTPDREQQLLKMYKYDMYVEQNYYGKEGFTHKVKHNNTVISKLFTDIYKSIEDKSKEILSKSIDFNNYSSLKTDLSNKENFITTLQENSKKILALFNIIRKLADDNIDKDKEVELLEKIQKETNANKMYINVINSVPVRYKDAHFESKDDIHYLINCLNTNKASVNVPQIHYYINKLVDKVNKDDHNYAVETYDYISNILSDMHISLLQNASLLSKGNRFLARFEYGDQETEDALASVGDNKKEDKKKKDDDLKNAMFSPKETEKYFETV